MCVAAATHYFFQKEGTIMKTLFITLLIIAIILWVLYLIAKEFYAAALAKGYSDKKYFWFCFLLGMVGYLLVIALPDRRNTPKAISDELPDL